MVDLSQAPRIVAVGRGIKSQEHLPLAESLAKALGAELAASRPICDSGWLPWSGRLAARDRRWRRSSIWPSGFQGAIQHLVGRRPRTIVAINKDPTPSSSRLPITASSATCSRLCPRSGRAPEVTLGPTKSRSAHEGHEIRLKHVRAARNLDVDVLIVGGGPAGLSAALRLGQLQKQGGGAPLSVAVLEKARDAGAHELSGAVLDPLGANRAIPTSASEALLAADDTANVSISTERASLPSSFRLRCAITATTSFR